MLLAVLAAALVVAVAVPAVSLAMSQPTATYWLNVDAQLRCQQIFGSGCANTYITGPWTWPGWGTYGWSATAVYPNHYGVGSSCVETINTWGSSTQEGWNVAGNFHC